MATTSTYAHDDVLQSDSLTRGPLLMLTFTLARGVPDAQLDDVLEAAAARGSKEDRIREALRAGETTIAVLGLGPLLETGEGRPT